MSNASTTEFTSTAGQESLTNTFGFLTSVDIRRINNKMANLFRRYAISVGQIQNSGLTSGQQTKAIQDERGMVIPH